MRIETPRLSITPVLAVADIDELRAVFNSNPRYLAAADGRRSYSRRDVEAYVRTETRRENGRCLAIRLRDGGELIGTAALLVPHADGRLWIGLLILRGDLQGQGLGREAAAALEEALAREGWREVRLGVLAGEERALRFWASAGYEVVDERPATTGAPCRVLAKAIGIPAPG